MRRRAEGERLKQEAEQIVDSVVAEDITLTGNANFHYDESLGNLGTGNPFRVAKWKELTTATERSAVSSKVSF